MPTDRVLPCAVLVDGPLGSAVLIPGVTYRVVETREHWEPSPNEGEPPHISTVIRFEPAALAASGATLDVPDARLDLDALAETFHWFDCGSDRKTKRVPWADLHGDTRRDFDRAIHEREAEKVADHYAELVNARLSGAVTEPEP